jgi:hypothetical protein
MHRRGGVVMSEFDDAVMNTNRAFDSMKQEIADLKAKLERCQRKYSDLIMSVARKFDGESRHETARRYIQEAEERAVSGTELAADTEGEKR